MEMTLFEGIILGMALLAAGLVVVFTLRTGISPMPSSGRAQRAMLDLLGDQARGPIYELGSGWGGLAIAAARKYPDVQVVGLELSPVPWLYSVVVGRALGLSNLSFRRADFFEIALEEPATVLCYLYPDGMTRLANKLAQELSPEALVISNTFRAPGWEPEEVTELKDVYRTRVYRYAMGQVLTDPPPRPPAPSVESA